MNKQKKTRFPADDRLARFTFSDTRRESHDTELQWRVLEF